jgi:hypothetical protein
MNAGPVECEFCTTEAARACGDPQCRARGYGYSRTPSHLPHRGSDVEFWILNTRNETVNSAKWTALDDLLDDYRLRADYGLTLSDSTEGCQ